MVSNVRNFAVSFEVYVRFFKLVVALKKWEIYSLCTRLYGQIALSTTASIYTGQFDMQPVDSFGQMKIAFKSW